MYPDSRVLCLPEVYLRRRKITLCIFTLLKSIIILFNSVYLNTHPSQLLFCLRESTVSIVKEETFSTDRIQVELTKYTVKNDSQHYVLYHVTAS